MDKFLVFLKIIAWFAGVASTLLLILCSYLTLKYPGSLDELRDKLNGVKRSYPVLPWLIIAVVCWAFIIAF